MNTQFETLRSKWTLYSPFVICRAESACFPRERTPPLPTTANFDVVPQYATRWNEKSASAPVCWFQTWM